MNRAVVIELIKALRSSINFPSALLQDLHWLKSDPNSNRWTVADPISGIGQIDIKFDARMIDGGVLSDRPEIIVDAKISFIFAVQFSNFKTDCTVSSLSKMRRFVNDTKRIINERIAMGFDTWASFPASKNKKLLERLALRESVSQSYIDKIAKYVDKAGILNLPLKIEKGNKHPSKIDHEKIYSKLGFNSYAAYRNEGVLAYWQELHQLFNQLSPNLQLEVIEERIGKKNVNLNVNQEQFNNLCGVLRHIYDQSLMMTEYFYDPCLINVVNKNIADCISKKLAAVTQKERTRNIPIPLFLQTLDASVRFVLDYAEPLFEAESRLVVEFNRLEKEVGSYQAGKNVNVFAKKMGVFVDGKYSPFPLAAYKHAQSQASSISTEHWKEVELLIKKKIKPKDIRKRLGLTKPQYDYMRKEILYDPFGKKFAHSGVSLNQALYQFLPLCCLNIIFAFSARRESEVFGLEVDCYDETDEGWNIEFYCAKTFRSKRWFTTVPVVIKALQTLERLSESGREKTGSKSLFAFDDAFNRAPISFDRIERTMDRFLDFIGAERDENGERFKFSEHQFRRFFAAMYVYRYDKNPNFEALMNELAHEDWSMTEVYITEQECGQILKEMELERAAEWAVKASVGDGVGGAMAHELRDSLKRAIAIHPENRKEIAITHMKENSINIELLSGGVCFGNTPKYRERSNCFGSGHVMSHRASKEMCCDCPNLLTVDELRGNSSNKIAKCEESSILQGIVGIS